MVAVILLFDDVNCYCKYQRNVIIVLRYIGHGTLQSVVKSNTHLFLWYNVKDSAFKAQNLDNYMWLSHLRCGVNLVYFILECQKSLSEAINLPLLKFFVDKNR